MSVLSRRNCKLPFASSGQPAAQWGRPKTHENDAKFKTNSEPSIRRNQTHTIANYPDPFKSLRKKNVMNRDHLANYFRVKNGRIAQQHQPCLSSAIFKKTQNRESTQRQIVLKMQPLACTVSYDHLIFDFKYIHRLSVPLLNKYAPIFIILKAKL